MAIDRGRNSKPSTPNEHAWHALACDKAVHVLGSSPQGLGAHEAAIRVHRDGLNELPAPARPNAFIRFLGQLNNWLIYFPALAASATSTPSIRSLSTRHCPPASIGETVCVILALVLGLALPMTPVQILWINMVLTITLGLVLAFEPGVMSRPPRLRETPILSRFLAWRIGFVSLLFTGVFFFDYALQRGLGEDGVRTMVVNVLVVMEIFYLFNIRYLHTTSFSLAGALGTPAVLGAVTAVVVAQLAFTYLPLMQSLFGSTPLSIEDSSVVLLVGVALMAVLEVEKAFMRRLRSGRQSAVHAA